MAYMYELHIPFLFPTYVIESVIKDQLQQPIFGSEHKFYTIKHNTYLMKAREMTSLLIHLVGL